MAWTEEEDEQLRKLVAEFGPKKWVFVASKMENKGGKQCRRRWQNYLNCDNNKQGGWSPEEDEVLMVRGARRERHQASARGRCASNKDDPPCPVFAQGLGDSRDKTVAGAMRLI